MSDENKDFVVKDTRFSSKENEDNPEAAENEPESKTSKKEKFSETHLPAVNFSTFIFSLNSSALVHLGLVEDPATGQKNTNIQVAKQTIDIIAMLEEKTSGNLSSDEEQLIKGILYELRMMYVKATAK